jgi:tetratricopeptide (TPR) repeat protein
MDQEKLPNENPEHATEELDNMEFSDFDDVENLDDFFDDEGQSGADVFETELNDDNFEQAVAAEMNNAKNTGAMSGTKSGLLRTAVSTVLFLAVVGGGGYFLYTNDTAKGFISDLTGMQIGTGEQMANNGAVLSADNNESDPFATDISMNDLAVEPMGMDMPSPTPLSNTQETFNANDGVFNDMPQPIANQTRGNEQSTKDNDFSKILEQPEDMQDFAQNDDFFSPSNEKSLDTNIKQNGRATATDLEDLASPVPALPVSNNAFDNLDTSNKLPLNTAQDTKEEEEKPDLEQLLGAKPMNDLDAAETAKEYSQTFMEADENFLDLKPVRKPGYEIEIHTAGNMDATGEYIPENKPKVAGSHVSNTADVKTQIITEADDDPLLIAAERAMKLQRYDSALRLYETLEIMNPRYSRALKGKADALRALGRLAEAELMYRKAKEFAPNDTSVEGAILGVQATTNPNSALNSLLLKHRQDQTNPNVAAQIAVSYAGLGDYERSYLFWQKANSLKANNPIYLYNMAVAADKTGRFMEAVSLYEKALYIDGTFHQGKNIKRANVYDRLSILRKKTR